jgi:transposase
MSLKPQPTGPVPDDTARVARAVFPKSNLCLTLRDEIGIPYNDSDFGELFSSTGQPAACPWRLALVCILQFIEDLPDRQAADVVRARIDWKYALALPLENPGFDASVLSEFRTRLLNHKLGESLLELLLIRLKEKGWLKFADANLMIFWKFTGTKSQSFCNFPAQLSNLQNFNLPLLHKTCHFFPIPMNFSLITQLTYARTLLFAFSDG